MNRISTTADSSAPFNPEYYTLSPTFQTLIDARFDMAQHYAAEKAAQAQRAEQARRAREAHQAAEIRRAIELHTLALAKVPPSQRAGVLQRCMHIQRLREWEAAGRPGREPKAPDLRTLRPYLKTF